MDQPQQVNRIAFICHPYHRGGVTRWMADAAIEWSKKGCEVYFVTVSPVREFVSGTGKETLIHLLRKEANDVKIISADVGYEFEFGTPEYKAWVYKKLIVQVPAGTPVILSDDLSVWAAATALHIAYPLVGVMHADEDHYYDLAARYWRDIAVFACVSERVKATTKKRIPDFNAANIFTIPCGIQLPPAPVFTNPEDILQLVFAGRVSEYQKRAGDLLKIAEQLAKSGKPFHLTIIGDGDMKPVLKKAVKEKGLEQSVSFPGWLSQKEVAQALAKSDILLLTSDFEGTPIAMMEAFAAGCGMVGTRVSGIEDYERHPFAADCLGVYTVGNIDEAILEIERIAAVPETARKKSARKLAETEFSMDVCLKRYEMAMGNIKTPKGMPSVAGLRFSQLAYSRVLALARYLKIKRASKP